MKHTRTMATRYNSTMRSSEHFKHPIHWSPFLIFLLIFLTLMNKLNISTIIFLGVIRQYIESIDEDWWYFKLVFKYALMIIILFLTWKRRCTIRSMARYWGVSRSSRRWARVHMAKFGRQKIRKQVQYVLLKKYTKPLEIPQTLKRPIVKSSTCRD